MIVAQQRLCGCTVSADSVGRVLEVRTCPWCCQLALLDIRELVKEVDRVLSVSAVTELDGT